MKNYIQVNNFRKYISTPKLELNDLNFFVGTNSSGKSTLVKAYMLIVAYITEDKFYDIDFNSSAYQNLNIQDFNRLKSKFTDSDSNIEIKLALNNFVFRLELMPHENSNYAKVLNYSVQDILNDIIYEYKYVKGNKETMVFQTDSSGNPIYEEYLSEEIFQIRLINNEKYVDEVKKLIDFLIQQEENEWATAIYQKDLEEISKVTLFDDVIISGNTGFINYNSFKREANSLLSYNLFNVPPKDIKIDDLLNYKTNIQKIFRKYRTLNINNKVQGSIDPNTVFSVSLASLFGEVDKVNLSNGMELPSKTKELFKLIFSLKNVFLPLTYKKYTNLNSMLDKSNDLAQLLHIYYNSNRNNKEKQIRDRFIEKWLTKNYFNIGEAFEINFYGGEAYEVLIHERGEKIPLVDKGTGNVQLFKILLLIATHIIQVDKNLKTTIILEEPELNLHPSLQSKLADLIVETYKNHGLKFIIETHSEYLIRRLQVLAIQNKLDRDKISITYFPTELDQEPYNININKDGSLDKNFGSGFFDEASNHTLELIKFKRLSQN
ncbi:AAA family ATPase [Empedobacter falsenii]|uniref:AAA family ATPase n=1 Tax=Empedobacter falsenii TaxID=343874 RepID=A0ABY8VD93_9FLAO|nr:AAA family ATPase [Empedobacter falsenii]WIH98214.1 AAA family ATPase [Empedobacter falsenii]